MQYNKHRSKDVVTADFLRNPRVLEADIIAVQEPWDNPYTETTHHPAKQTHELVFPSINETGERASVISGDFNLHQPAWGGDDTV
ncbi:hypothetical protein N7499_012214 [Penicillium canescens]|uniref:Endonuclease/exonuclease/phosphatase domain-containing protein n=1 Tax=Penicillium canescens TaxID=5083 RepID=A0AAD6I348_PENCN|nr:hypothetical protein N7522_003528 [Penicillium canescens]KAJ6029805.1 hypothetical protein N7460_010071 [Penicillium canescens]KAJ6063534.1 hypothetical protein N7499_012214 [Penicillium canescens]KAJ6154970.1 hypothetical protein N7485_013339 [Penicillium canescens]